MMRYRPDTISCRCIGALSVQSDRSRPATGGIGLYHRRHGAAASHGECS